MVIGEAYLLDATCTVPLKLTLILSFPSSIRLYWYTIYQNVTQSQVPGSYLTPAMNGTVQVGEYGACVPSSPHTDAEVVRVHKMASTGE